jgi:hypothetical protein
MMMASFAPKTGLFLGELEVALQTMQKQGICVAQNQFLPNISGEICPTLIKHKAFMPLFLQNTRKNGTFKNTQFRTYGQILSSEIDMSNFDELLIFTGFLHVDFSCKNDFSVRL